MADAPEVTKRSCPLHPGLAALDFPRSIIAPGARREGPSLAHHGSRGIHAAQPLTQRFHSAS
ncbi:nucleoid-structuring protein H-NS [Pseudomonas sp. HMWF032]|nr:nucleoid-structuring protein H-NS [Pseudomonas sp. HMWF032]PTT86070.1 nucleoid-structuring protein H-NS [Pseudomonas sp. HMWF010]